MPNPNHSTGSPAPGSPEALLEAGLTASQANDVDHALDYFARASAAAPAWAIPHFLIGSEYAAQGQMDKAEAAIANAVLLDPGLHIARYQLGLLQFSSGRAAAALVTWQPIMQLQGEQGLPHFVRGFAALAQDRIDEAKEHFAVGLTVPEVNPAVASDIQKVLTGLAALNQGPTDKAAQSPNESSAHVLVSTYSKYSLH